MNLVLNLQSSKKFTNGSWCREFLAVGQVNFYKIWDVDGGKIGEMIGLAHFTLPVPFTPV